MASKNTTDKDAASVRQRLIDSADRLFYQEGFRAVGIDRVLAEAGAAKASLYAHFGSKDELVAACIERRTLDAKAQILAYVEAVEPEQRPLRLFDFLVDWVSQDTFRGCPVQHLVAEFPEAGHPARQQANLQRQWLQGQLELWCGEAALSDAKQTARALAVLFDGALAAAEQDGPERASDARWAAAQLLDAHR